MITFLIIMAVLVSVFIGCGFAENKVLKKSKRVMAIEPKTVLSWPAGEIVKWYNKLPDDMQFEDITDMVKALDLKYGVERVNGHFSKVIESNSYPYRHDIIHSWKQNRIGCEHLDDCLTLSTDLWQLRLRVL